MAVVLSKRALATSRRFTDTEVLFGYNLATNLVQDVACQYAGPYLLLREEVSLVMIEVCCWCKRFDCCKRKSMRKIKKGKKLMLWRKPGGSVQDIFFAFWFVPVQERIIVTVGVHDIYSLLSVTSVVVKKQTKCAYAHGIVTIILS